MFQRFNQIKEWIVGHEKDLFIAFLVILSSTLSYGLGRLSYLERIRTPVTISQGSSSTPASIQIIEDETSADTRIVASQKGTKYYYPWCGGSKTIKSENRRYFTTAAAAELAGYTRAGNCPVNP